MSCDESIPCESREFLFAWFKQAFAASTFLLTPMNFLSRHPNLRVFSNLPPGSLRRNTFLSLSSCRHSQVCAGMLKSSAKRKLRSCAGNRARRRAGKAGCRVASRDRRIRNNHRRFFLSHRREGVQRVSSAGVEVIWSISLTSSRPAAL